MFKRFNYAASYFGNTQMFCFYCKFISVTVRRIIGLRTDGPDIVDHWGFVDSKNRGLWSFSEWNADKQTKVSAVHRSFRILFVDRNKFITYSWEGDWKKTSENIELPLLSNLDRMGGHNSTFELNNVAIDQLTLIILIVFPDFIYVHTTTSKIDKEL